MTSSGGLLTFSNDLLHGDLVSPDSEASPDEISSRVTGPGAAASSRTGPGADQLPARIKELPHVVVFFFFFLASRSHTAKKMSCFPDQRLAIAMIYNSKLVKFVLKHVAFVSYHDVERFDLFWGGNFPFATSRVKIMQVNYTTREVKASPEKVFLSQTIQLFVLGCC